MEGAHAKLDEGRYIMEALPSFSGGAIFGALPYLIEGASKDGRYHTFREAPDLEKGRYH